jgi:hypothetical protein
MTNLQVLVLAKLNITGSFDGAAIHGFVNLQHLDMSNGLIGTLPELWYVLTDLRVLDVSNTGVSGSLPTSYASLHELRVLRAASCRALSGTLPASCG